MEFKKKLEDFLKFICIHQDKLDEWYLDDFIDNNIKIFNSQEAFEAMKDIVQYIIKYPEYGYELLEILRRLKRIADTTEIFYCNDIPEKLNKIYSNDEYLFKIINEIFKKYS